MRTSLSSVFTSLAGRASCIPHCHVTSLCSSSSSSSSVPLLPTARLFSRVFSSSSSSASTPTAVALHHIELARGPSPAQKDPLVILHGLLGSANNWRSVAPKLSYLPHQAGVEAGAEAGSQRRTLSLDVRNHGSSPHVSDMSFEACAADVVALLDREGVTKCAVLGHSLGGKIAMATALLHPTRVSSLLVADMAPHHYRLHDPSWSGVSHIVRACAHVPLQLCKTRADVERYLKPHIEDFTQRGFVMQNVVVETDPHTQEKLGVKWRMNLHVLLDSIGYMATFPLSDTAAPYTGPALFIAGGDSPYLTPEHFESIHNLFEHAHIETIEGAGHWVHVEKPKEFAHICQKFLQKVP